MQANATDVLEEYPRMPKVKVSAAVLISALFAQAAEPTGTLTLACKGTEVSKGDAGTS
jgi:hypothetical protein